MFDVIIVGAGPAGANLARLLPSHLKTLIVDKRSLDHVQSHNPRTKCCGGLLAPDAQKMLAKLNLGIPKDILVNPQLFAVKTYDLSAHQSRSYQRYYYNIDREKFDRWLVSLIPTHVTQWHNTLFVDYSQTQDGYEITLVRNGQQQTVKTRFLVGADGAFSKVRRTLYGEINAPQTYISKQEWYSSTQPPSHFTAIFDASITDFYGWMIPKDHYYMVGAAFPVGEDAHKKFDMLKAKLTALGYDLTPKHLIKTEGAHINRPIRHKHLQCGKNGIFLVGEAAGAISPSSAEGISYALKSSYWLSQCFTSPSLLSFDIQKVYRIKMRKIAFNLRMKRLKSPAMYHPLLRKWIMKSGINSL